MTAGATEFLVRDRLSAMGIQVFCPYTCERKRVKVNARPRTVFKMVDVEIPRWPRYLFCKTQDTALLRATRDVSYIVKSTEGEAALLSDSAMAEIQADCDASGKVLARASLHRFSVGDLLKFVASSSFSGRSALVIGADNNGSVHVLVDAHVKATVDFRDLAA